MFCAMLDPRVVAAFKESLVDRLPSMASTEGVGEAAGRAVHEQMFEHAARGFASTGTAISTLHGAPRENAILSNLGGGPKLHGGLGMAGGQTALGRTSGRASLAAELTVPFIAIGCNIAADTVWRYGRAVWQDRSRSKLPIRPRDPDTAGSS